MKNKPIGNEITYKWMRSNVLGELDKAVKRNPGMRKNAMAAHVISAIREYGVNFSRMASDIKAAIKVATCLDVPVVCGFGYEDGFLAKVYMVPRKFGDKVRRIVDDYRDANITRLNGQYIMCLTCDARTTKRYYPEYYKARTKNRKTETNVEN